MNYPDRRSLRPTIPTATDSTSSSSSSWWGELAVQDWILLAYLGALLVATIGGEGPRRTTALAYLSIDIAVLVVTLGITRGKLLGERVGGVTYRLGLFGALFGSFAQLQYILPTARVIRVDAELYAFDKRVFGVEPAELFDRFVSNGTVEWFSFFYFGYFFILAAHIFPFLFGGSGMPRIRAELAFGLIALFCAGHLLYIVVPGYGPYQHLAGRFGHELEGPFWWPLVQATTDAGEVRARTDIFPSLHTAAPAFLAMFSVRHRRLAPFRFTWLPMVFFATQIAISTMFLRWHYLVDVIAGLVLAGAVAAFSHRVATWEATRRRTTGKAPVFP